MKKIIIAGIILIILIFVAGPGTPGSRVLIGTPMEWLVDILSLIYYTFAMYYISIPLILIFLFPIIWALKPVNDYKGASVLRIGYLLTGIMFIIFLISIWLLYEILTCKQECFMVGLLIPLATIGFLTSIFTIPLFIQKSRKALKEIKEEAITNQSRI